MLTLGLCQARDGDEVWFCVPEQGPLRGVLAGKGLRVLDTPFRGWRSKLAMAAFCKANQIDIAHGHLTSAVNAAVVISFLTKTKPIAHAHVLSSDANYRLAARRGALIAVGDDVANFYRTTARIPKERIRTVVNSTLIHEEPDASRPREEIRAEICAELAIPSDSFLILLPGRLSRPKAQDVVLDAAPSVLAKFPKAHFVFAGTLTDEPEFASFVQEKVVSMKLESSVHILGWRADVARLNRAADVVLVPSRWDPFPLAVIEGMMLGCAIVGARVGGIPEMLPDGRFGLLVEAENPDELADGIVQLLSDTNLAGEIAANAKLRAQELYSPEAMVRNVRKLYEVVLDRSS